MELSVSINFLLHMLFSRCYALDEPESAHHNHSQRSNRSNAPAQQPAALVTQCQQGRDADDDAGLTELDTQVESEK